MFSCSTNLTTGSQVLFFGNMASSDVVMIRDSGSSSSNIQQQYLCPDLCDLTGRVRTQESTCDKPGCTGYGATSSAAATPLDSPTHSTDPPITFSEQEDEILRELVKRHGTKKWHIISAKMHKKTPRECRKRWRTYLHMCMNKSSWSAEEDHLLLQGHNAFGNRWTEIAKMVPGRTDNAVKNRYNALCTKRSHPAAKAVNGFSSSNGIKHHLVESWNDANGHQYEQELKRARRVAQEEEESSQPWMKVSFRAATMAYLKSNMIFETSCSRLDLGIDDIPQVDSDHNRTSVSRKRIIDLHEPGQIISQEEDYVLTNVGDSTTSPKDVHVDMEEVMGWLLQSQTSTPTFDCSGNSNSTVTSCTPLTSVSTVLSRDSTNPDSFGAEQEGLSAKLNIQRCANNSIFEETLGFDTTAYFV